MIQSCDGVCAAGVSAFHLSGGGVLEQLKCTVENGRVEHIRLPGGRQLDLADSFRVANPEAPQGATVPPYVDASYFEKSV